MQVAKMRLIDIGQAIFVPIVDETNGGAIYEAQMTVEEFFDKFLDEFKPELIEAIPMKWLIEQEHNEAEALSAAANTVIKAWLTKDELK